ncbi:MAG: hypothetical protein R2755_02725 [Acidimicrobiales bacterium]
MERLCRRDDCDGRCGERTIEAFTHQVRARAERAPGVEGLVPLTATCIRCLHMWPQVVSREEIDSGRALDRLCDRCAAG